MINSLLNEEDAHMLDILKAKAKNSYILHERLHSLLKELLDEDSVTEFFDPEVKIDELRRTVSEYRLICWNTYNECQEAIDKLTIPIPCPPYQNTSKE